MAILRLRRWMLHGSSWSVGCWEKEDFRFFRRVLGFRNIVVHEYLAVDLSLVDAILRERRYRRVLLLAERLYREERRNLDP